MRHTSLFAIFPLACFIDSSFSPSFRCNDESYQAISSPLTEALAISHYNRSTLRMFWEIVVTLLEVWACVFSVFGNSVVIYVMSREKKLRRKSNYYVISVAIADLLVGLVVIPFSFFAVKSLIHVLMSRVILILTFQVVTGGPFNETVCLSLISVVLAVFAVSIYSLMAVSLDRYFAIYYPISYKRNVGTKFTKFTIGFCWLAGIFGFLPLMGWNSGIFDPVNGCDTRDVLDFDYLMFFCIITSFIPTIVLTAVYILIHKKIVHQVRPLRHDSRKVVNNVYPKQIRRRTTINNNTEASKSSEKEARAAKTLSMVVGSFLVLWVPMTISYFAFAVIRDRKFNEEVLDICMILSHFNSAIDPLIYAYRIKDVREALKGLFRCSRRSCTTVNETSSTVIHLKTVSRDVDS